MKLVDDAKECWRWVSMWCMALAGALQGAWLFIPDDLKGSMPPNVAQAVTVALLVLGVLGRLVDQGSKK